MRHSFFWLNEVLIWFRLTCYCLFHWACLDKHCRGLPGSTAPAGYTCPQVTLFIYLTNAVDPDLLNPDKDPDPAFLVNPDTDPDPDATRIQGFDDQNWRKKEIQLKNFFFDQNTGSILIEKELYNILCSVRHLSSHRKIWYHLWRTHWEKFSRLVCLLHLSDSKSGLAAKQKKESF